MTAPKDDDPFSWDVDRVVQELCTSKRSWKPTPRMQFPDPADLEAKLRDGDYDGELLLHSLTSENDLWSDLGITKGKFKQTIRTAIAQLRTRSPEYRKYERSLRYAPEEDLPLKKEARFLSPGLTDAATPNSVPVDGPTPEQASWEAPAQPSSMIMHNELRRTCTDVGDASAKPKKKRRLDANDLTSVELPARDTAVATAVLTEADMLNFSSQPSNLLDQLISGPGAYWGEGKLTLEDLFVHDIADVQDTREFGWVQSGRIGRAKAEWANNKIKAYLREPSRLYAADPDDLPPFGESDEEDNPVWDLIEREIEDEEEEVRREKLRAQATSLHADAIDASLQRMIEDLIAHWKETKLSNHQRKAYKVWNQAQQSGSRNQQIIQLTQSLRNENIRLQAKVKYLRDNSYSSRKELHDMKPTLEPTVFEIEKMKWTVNVLQSSRAPEKISTPSAPRPSKKPKVSSDGGIDIWSEDELDDFIVDDEDPTRVSRGEPPAHIADDQLPAVSDQADDVMDKDADAMDIDAPQIHGPGQSFGSTSDGDVDMFDLTQVENADDPIALDTPIKSKPRTSSQLSSAQGDDAPPFSDPEAIAEKGTEHWENRCDCRRLIVTRLFNLAKQRRVKVLESAIYSDTPEDLWQDQIEIAVKSFLDGEQPSDKVRREVAMAVARYFHNFCGYFHPSGGDTSPAAWRLILQRLPPKKTGYFEEFWSFLRFLAPYFNIKQIDEEDILSKDIALEEDKDMTPHQKSTKARLQKSARIRLDETHSSQAKEARRINFRRQVSEGAAKMVINESKEAGQGLVYVHPHIAEKIRPHQVEGVRFMWDEITKDTHKGCLLAHTMGLGKTMQTITLLCALAESVTSGDITISSQVPDHLKAMKVVILCPVNVLTNWVEELRSWTPPGLLGNFYKLESSVKEWDRRHIIEDWAKCAGSSVLIIGYNLLIHLKPEVRQRILDVCSIVIADEAHKFKNRTTQTGKAVNSFNTTSRIALTGSPLSNNVKEYYSMIDWVAPGFLGEPGEFNTRYSIPIEYGFSKNSDLGSVRKAKVLLAALKKLVETKVHRMSMLALKGDLPPKVEFIIYLDLSEIQMAAYNAYLQGDLRNRPGGKILVNNVWVLQSLLPLLLAHPSIYHQKLKKDRAKIVDDMKEMKELIAEVEQPLRDTSDEADTETPLGVSSEMASDALRVFDEPNKYNAFNASFKMMVLEKIIQESSKLGDNVLVFSQKLPILDYVQEHLLRKKSREWYRIDGKVDPNKRQAIVHKFNKSHGAVFLISTTSGGVGLNLQGANRVVIMDSQYNPTHEQQAVGRAWRIGQTKPVFVYWLLCDGTYEKTMQSKQIFKTQLSSRVVDDKAPIAKSDGNLKEWFRAPVQIAHQDTSRFQGRDTVLDAVLADSDLSAGISSMETTDTFEEEEEDKDLQPHELEQAHQMALGNISEVSLPQYTQVGQHPSSSPKPIVAPSYHQPEAGGTVSSPLPIALQATQHVSEARSEAGQGGTELISTPEYAGPENLARRLSRASAPSGLELLSHGPADGRYLLGSSHKDSLANTPKQTLTGIPSTLPAPRMIPFGTGGIPPSFTPCAPLPFSMPGAEQIRKRVTLGGDGQTDFSISNSRPFTPLRDTPQPLLARQLPHQQFSDAGPSATSGHLNGDTNRQAARPMSLPGQAPVVVADDGPAAKARDNFKLALRNALGPSLIVQSEKLMDRLDQEMSNENLLGLAKRTVWLKLTSIVQNHTGSAQAMISPVSTAHILITAEREQLVRALGMPATQDPDHARQFLQRSSKKEIGTSSAADLAVMKIVLKKRKERPFKREKQQSKTPRPSDGSGSSMFNPLVIDD